MVAGALGDHAPASGPSKEPELEQVGLDDIFESARVFIEGRGNGFESNRTAVVDVADGLEITAIELVESESIDPFERERVVDDLGRDLAVGADHGKVANATEETVCDARRAS